jgi:hypothetical protein
MRVFAILFGVSALFIAATMLLMGIAREAMFLIPIVAAGVLRLVLARIAPHWSNRRAIVIAALMVPLLAWLIAFGMDLSIVAERKFYGDRSAMGGFTIVLLWPCVNGFLWGLVVAFAVTRLGKLGPQR